MVPVTFWWQVQKLRVWLTDWATALAATPTRTTPVTPVPATASDIPCVK